MQTEELQRLNSLSPAKRALLIEAMRRKAARTELEERIPRRPADAPVPLSYAQQRLWFLHQLQPDSAVYNVSSALRFAGSLDLVSFRAALSEVARRHEVLRTTFPTVGGDPVQRIAPAGEVPVPVIDVSMLPVALREAEARRLAAMDVARPFDLQRGPLLRVVLLRLAPEVHEALFTVHHIVSDEWSNAVFTREVTQLYSAFLRGERLRLPEPELQYADFAYWQRHHLQGDVLEKLLDYWRRQLADLKVLELPADHARPALQTFRGERRFFSIPDRLTEALRQLAREEGVTLFMAVLAVYQTLLHRLSGQDDVVVGSPVANRNRSELDPLIGCFVNALVLRIRFSEDPTFRELLQRVRTVVIGASDHQDLPFEKLVEELQPERDPSRNPLFQAVIAFQNTPRESLELPSLSLSSMEVENLTAKFDLRISLVESGGGMAGAIEHNTDLFDRTTAVRWLDSWTRLLASAVEFPDQPVWQLEMLADGERQQILAEWNDTAQPVAGPETIHGLVEAQARRAPAALAVVADEESLDAGEVSRRANRLAHHLRGLGVGVGSLVGVYLGRSAAMVPALLGILKSGGAYVPIDSSYPAARVEWILSSLGIRWVVSDETLADALPAGVEHVVRVGGGSWPAGAEHDPQVVVTGEDLAYIIFTSGSTGHPKGVMVRHRPAVNLIGWVQGRFGMGPADRGLFITSLSFDLSVYDVFGLLAAGGTVRVVSEEALREPERLVDLLEHEPITFWDSAPAALQQLVPFFAGRPAAASRLRLVFLSGDWIPVTLSDEVRSRYRGAQVISLGGATEATVWSNVYPIGEVPPHWRSIPYGRPIRNARYLILDGHLQPCPIGAPGDLYIGGGCLAAGYAGRPELTADRFIPDHFAMSPGSRLYRTGDRARFWADGTMEFLGRLDQQVKVRGFRVELGEIEAALADNPGVADAVVVAWEDSSRHKRLVAYVVARNGERLEIAELRRFLAERLPAYMVPSAFVELEALPVTSNGKLDRRALPPPDGARREGAGSRTTPRTPIEELLVDMWAQVLQLDQVGVDDDFFELGGHSLIATQLVARMREAFQVDLPLRSFFEAPTVGGMAAEIHRLRRNQAEGDYAVVELPQIVPDRAHRSEPFPLTDIQQAYWVGRSGIFELGNVATHLYREIEGEGLDLERFNQALQRMIDRHDMLRSIVQEDGQQRILEDVPPYRIPIVDLRGKPAVVVETALTALRDELSHQILPADRWPLFDIRAARLDGDRIRMYFSFDLLIGDGWSFQIMFRELSTVYRNPELEIAPLELSFRDYVVAERALEETELYRRSARYWRSRLATLPPAPDLPLAVNPAALTQPRFGRRTSSLPPAVWSGLKARASRLGLTPSGLLLAAYARVLGTWSKSHRLTINLTLFNRLPLHPEVNDLIGDFTSLILLAVEGVLEESFQSLARRLQNQLWDDMDHRYFSGVRVQRELARLQGNPTGAVMPVVFTSALPVNTADQEQTAEAADQGGLADGPTVGLTSVYGIAQTPQVWLDHQASEREGLLIFNWDAVEDLFPAGLLDSMFESYCGWLHRLAEDEAAWSDPWTSLLPTADLALQATANATAAPVPEGLLHTRIAEQARLHPERTAVLAGGREIRYGELWNLARHLGGWLRTQGAEPNQLVAVVMEKGWEQVAAVLGVLVSGAAYLPIDPDLPRERIWYLLAEGQVRLAVTQPWVEESLEWPAGIVRLAVSDTDLAAAPAAELEPVQGPADLAYAIFTSGSTGQPKGVMIDHRGALNTIVDVNRRFGVGPADRVLALSSLSFDLSVYDVFGLLSAGGAVVMPEPWAAREPSRWRELMERHGVTLWNTVPALLEMLVEHASDGEVAAPLRLALLSGDWVPVRLPERARRIWPELALISLGGATEASIWSILYPIGEVDPGWVSIPYGRPMLNQRFYVLDERLEPRPVWVPGMLYIGGVGLALGYWRDAEKTAASFVLHPRTGERLYRTGDLGRYLPSGDIEFLGREDFQVKVQGYRIELGEIETALEQHPALRAAVVVVAAGASRTNRRLVAYVVAEEGERAAPEELRAWLAERLPAYMMPAVWMELESLPLTSNGKVDRKALPAPEPAGAEEKEGFVAPRTPLEREIAAIWSEVLGVANVGIHDNLFELGGNSLLAIQLVNQMRKTLRLELPLRRLFETPTIAGVAVALASAGEVQAAAPLETLRPDRASRNEPFPLNDVQQAYWIGRDALFELGNVAPHGYRELDLQGLDVQRLERALQRLIDRHDMLRAVVLPDGRQRILAEVPPYCVECQDLRGKDPAEVEQALAETRRELSHQVLTGERWPLFEVRASLLDAGWIRLHTSIDLLLSDAWSGRILAREIALFYLDPEIRLPEIEVSFRDYVLAECELESSDSFRQAQEYWWRRLDSLPPAPDLPMVKRPSEILEPRFTRRREQLPAAVWERVRRRGAAAGLSPSGITLAAFADVLAAWSKSPRFTLNITTFNRLPLHPQVNRIVGDFTALTLLEADATAGRSFEERARALQKQLWEDLEHRQLGGIRVLRELARRQGRRTAAMMPVVFTSTFYQEEKEAPPESSATGEGSGGRVRQGESAYGISQTPQVWLDHQVMEEAGVLLFNWDAVEDLFPVGLLDAMFESYCGWLHRLAEDEAAWSDPWAGLLPAADLALQATANATAAPVPEGLLHTRIAEQARLHPERTAVLAGGREIRYGELWNLARHLGGWLRTQGAEPNQLVAVVMEKGWEQVAAVLGVLVSGAAYLPIDPDLPRERIWYLLAEGQVRLAVTQPWVEESLEWPAGIVRLAVSDTDLAVAPAAELEPVQGPADLAYAIFTSGSTGQPKGVMIDHRGALNTIVDVNRRFGVGPADRVLALSSLSFDLSVYDVFGLLSAGGAVVMPEPWAAREPSRWRELMERHGVTLWNTVPALLEMLVEHASDGEVAAPLRLALLSGDWVPVRLPERARRIWPELALISLGGATEASIWSILYPIGEVDPGWVSIPYGRPMLNQRFYVLDERLEPRPVWVPGMLYIGGVGLALGYWRDAEKTAASFVVHPRSGERLYRTGDLGRYLPSGDIEFLGREDFQVKVQGYRIELGEIETALEQHPALRAAVVVAAGASRTNRRLVAYVVAEEGERAAPEELRAWLAERLPAYMMPAVWMELESLPLTSNGKVDRKALPAPEPAGVEEKEGFVAPRTPLEREIAAIWSEVLGVANVGIHDNFFELGGHSLLATQVTTRVREVLGTQIPLRSLFEAGTVADLALEVGRRKSERLESTEDLRLPALLPDAAGRFEPFPLNDVQLAYWVGRSGALELGNVSTHTYFELEDEGLDVERLALALNRLIRRHDMLRAIILPDGRQQILAEVPFYEIETLDLRGRGAEEVEEALAGVRSQMSHQILPADRWPLFELRASLLAGGRVRLNVSVDILLMDAWSSGILLRELGQLYRDLEDELEPLAITFRDYILAAAALEETETYQRSRAYWREHLASLPPAPELPLVAGPSALVSAHFTRRRGLLSAGRWSRIKAFAVRRGLTPSGVVLAAFAEALAAWSKSPRFTLNVTTFNRLPLHPQVNQIIGDFTSLTLLAIDNSRGETFELRARQAQEQLWEDLEHRHFGGVRVLRDLARSQGRLPGALMPVVFTSLLIGGRSEPGETLDLADEPLGAGEGSAFAITQTPQVWLDHQVAEQGGALSFNWDAVEDLFPPGMLDAMFAAFRDLLRRLAEDEAAWSKPSGSLVPQAHLDLVVAANATEAPVPEGLLHARIGEQARRHPERVAVISREREVGYGEIWNLAQHLGGRLRAQGAVPNQLVAVVMEKGWEQVGAVLGVLVSGAAYLPIDPDLPRERVWHLLERGEVRLALTQPWVDERLEWPPGVARMVVSEADLAAVPAADLEPVQEPGDLAYVIFTSGSTGQPKGVMIDHRGALNTIVDVNQRFDVGPEDRVLALSSLSFDLSVYDVFGLLSVGGALVIPEPWATREPSRWRELIERYGVTLWNSVPALLEMYVESLGEERDAGGVRLALLSGDWIPVRLPDRARRLWPGLQVISLGGATEASIWSILYPVGEVDPRWTAIPYGRAMLNQRFHVLDERLEPRPVWVPGALYIGGAGLALGYWRDEEKTAASFVTHPRTGERLYRTGDQGRYLPSGDIEFLGREDFQVKVQGYRIELGEIESALEQHPAVRAAVVVAAGPARSNRRLVAYVVPEREAAAPVATPVPLVERAELPPVPPFPPDAGEIEKLELRLSEPGLRRGDAQRPAFGLAQPETGPALLRASESRRTQREFSREAVSLSALSGLLGVLRQIEIAKLPFPKYRYPSAGNLYPVQTYVAVRPGGVEGLEAGLYYYHPKDDRLVLLAPGSLFGREVHYPVNRPVFDASAFSLFLVGRLDAIEPVYGDRALDYSILEAGYMGQLLMMEASGLGLGLCPVGDLDFRGIRPWLGLQDGDLLLHTLIGGRPLDASAQPALDRGAAIDAEPVAAGPVSFPLSFAPGAGHRSAVHLGSEIEKLELKLAQPGLRHDVADRPGVDLELGAPSAELLRLYRRRSSFREFLDRPVPFAELSALLGTLMQLAIPGAPTPRYRYPSAGDLHPVQVYVHIKPQRVDGLPGGLYYYHPKAHCLVLLAEGGLFDAGVHYPANRSLFEGSAFSLFLIGRMEAIAPVYGERAHAYSLLEAGFISQLLMTAAPDHRLGLCPVGDLEFGRIRPLFDLRDGDVLLHTLAGGVIPDELALTAAAGGARMLRDDVLLDTLQISLQERLPAYMVPAHFVLLEEMPLSSNGKVDRKALPPVVVSAQDAGAELVAPRNALEEQLAALWTTLLGVERVGIHDNFFALGGDSVKGVQLLARARHLGIELSVRQLFEHQTIAGIAAALGLSGGDEPLPVLAGQIGWMESGTPGAAHILWVSLEPGSPAARVEEAAAALLRRHDALRMAMERAGSGWRQTPAVQEADLSEVDLASLAPADRAGAMDTRLGELAAGLDPAAGVLARFALFRLDGEDRVALAVHPAAADEESLPLLLDDLESALARPGTETRPAGSFARAVRALTGGARSGGAHLERADWERQDASGGALLPLGSTGEGAGGVEEVWLEPEETLALTAEVLDAYRARLDEVLLAAVAHALAGWTASDALRLDIVRRPLPEELDGLDLARTVGCLTSVVPLRIGLAAGDSEGEILRAVKEQLRAVAPEGMGRLAALPESEILFIAPPSRLDERVRPWAPEAFLSGRRRLAIRARRSHGRLVLEWWWRGGEGFRDVVASLGHACRGALCKLAAGAASEEAQSYTPSDFPIAGLSQQDLDELVDLYGEELD